VVAGGNSYSSPAGDGWWTLAGKQGWFERFGATVTLEAGMTYTLSFNSLSPYNYDLNGNITGVDDRSTFLDDITVTMGVVPSPGALAVLGLGALGARRRRR
jgi:MYXO-CTERM domain-containing protein